MNAELRGTAQLSEFGSASLEVESYLSGSKVRSERAFSAANKGNFHAAVEWIPKNPECRASIVLAARIRLSVHSKTPALLQIDSLDVGGSTGFALRPCAQRVSVAAQSKPLPLADTAAAATPAPQSPPLVPIVLKSEAEAIRKAQGEIDEAVARLRVIRDEAQKVLEATAPSTQPAKQEVFWYVSLIEPKVVSDAFGKRIAERFLAVQVTIANKNQNRQFLLHDVSFDYSAALRPEQQAFCAHPQFENVNLCEFSSHELSLLRGVAEKGQALDPRNVLLRAQRNPSFTASDLVEALTASALRLSSNDDFGAGLVQAP